MIFRLLRPLRRAMSTKSRETSENVCARSARAAQGHEVTPMKTASIMIPRTWRYAAMTSRSANVGITSTTFVSMFRTSSIQPAR